MLISFQCTEIRTVESIPRHQTWIAWIHTHPENQAGLGELLVGGDFGKRLFGWVERKAGFLTPDQDVGEWVGVWCPWLLEWDPAKKKQAALEEP